MKFFVKQSFDELPSHVDQTKLPENQISTLFGKLAVFRKKHRFLTLSVCVVGLNLVYVMWGVLQVSNMQTFLPFIAYIFTSIIGNFWKNSRECSGVIK